MVLKPTNTPIQSRALHLALAGLSPRGYLLLRQQDYYTCDPSLFVRH